MFDPYLYEDCAVLRNWDTSFEIFMKKDALTVKSEKRKTT
jgi:hypothetical protein